MHQRTTTRVAALVFLALLMHPWRLTATVMVQIVTPNGIVLASDSKMIDNSGKSLGETPKIVLLSSTVAVASCDMSLIHAVVSDTRSLPPRVYEYNYEFESWIKSFTDIRDPTEMTSAIMNRIPQTFADYGLLIKANAFPERRLLAEYYVAGYTRESMPVINKILVPLDWPNAAVMPPELNVVHPLPPADPSFKFNAGCTHDAITKVTKREGGPYQRARELEPILLDKLLSTQDLTISEARRLATALVTVECEFSSASVGLPVQIVVIDKPPAKPGKVKINTGKTQGTWGRVVHPSFPLSKTTEGAPSFAVRAGGPHLQRPGGPHLHCRDSAPRAERDAPLLAIFEKWGFCGSHSSLSMTSGRCAPLERENRKRLFFH